MPDYEVVWKIDIQAASAQEAALEALAIHRDPESIATVFEVRERGCEKVKSIDVLDL
jgi:hypothetical protein